MKYRHYLTILSSAALMAVSPISVYAESTAQTEITETADSEEETAPEALEEAPGEAPGDAPEKPEGEQPDGQQPDGQPPEKPDGEGTPGAGEGGQPPEMPEGGQGGPGGSDGPGGPGGANTQTYDYTGELNGVLIAEGDESSFDDTTAEATEKDQNALLAKNGGTLTITNSTVTKTGDDNDGDSCNFYGLNSIALAVGSDSLLSILDTTLTADSVGSNAVFATDNATAYVTNTTIKTTADNSRGLDATYGGTIIADNVDIETGGDHCATIATDRGGGNISAQNSTLNTEGSGSPLLYSTGTIEVDNVSGTSTGSQIAGMEGYNTILIHNSELTSTITDKTASDPVANGVIIYQSTSGDAETSAGEKALFQATESALTSAITEGSMFYVTNTTADIVLSATTLDFDTENVNLLQVEGNDSNNWGSAGSNGGDVTFTALGEFLAGDISVDNISTLDLYLLESTSYTGAMTVTDNEAAESESNEAITVNLDSTSTWVVTADSTITNLNAEADAQIVDADGNVVTIIVNGETVLEGSSDVSVSVTGSYTDTVTTDEDNTVRETSIDRTEYEEAFAALE